MGESPQAYKKTGKMFRHLLLEKPEGYAVTFTKKRKSIGDVSNNSIDRITFYRRGLQVSAFLSLSGHGQQNPSHLLKIIFKLNY